MSHTLIDALLPASKSPRTADAAAPRASERGKDFAPVLNKALDARPAESTAPERDDDGEDWNADAAALAPASGEAAASGDAGSHQDGGVSEAAESEERADQPPGEADNDAEDAVEISAEGEAEAAAAAVAAVIAAPDTTSEQDVDLSAAIEAVSTVPAAENPAGEADPENSPAKPATARDATVEAGSTIAAATVDDAALPVEPATDDIAAAELTRRVAPNDRKSSGNPDSNDSAKRSAQASTEPDPAPEAAGQAHETTQQSAKDQMTTRAATDQPAATDDAKQSADSARAEAPKDQASAADALADLDIALESLYRGDAAGGETLDATSNDATDASAAPASPQTTEVGRAPAHSTALSRLVAERSLHASAESVGDNGGVDRGRFVGRVEGAIRAAQQRDGRVQVRLSPPELGALRIELTIQQGALAARLEAETPAARNLLLDNLPALRERLAQQDIRVERFDVDLRQDANSGGGSQQGTMQERQPRETEWRQNQVRSDRGRSAATTPLTTARTNAPAVASDLGLDVRV
jgi:flagellar hook-length control protein FliK